MVKLVGQQRLKRQQAQNQSVGFPGGSFNPIPQGSFFKGTPAGLLNINRFQPGQQNYLESLLSNLQQGSQNLNLPGQPLMSSNFDFAPIAQDAKRRFLQETVPSIAERFTSMGSGAALTSPDLYRQLSAGQSDLQSQLSALESQYRLQQAGLGLQEQGIQSTNFMNLLQQYLQPRQDTSFTPAQSSGFSTLVHGGANAAAQLLPYMFI